MNTPNPGNVSPEPSKKPADISDGSLDEMDNAIGAAKKMIDLSGDKSVELPPRLKMYSNLRMLLHRFDEELRSPAYAARHEAEHGDPPYEHVNGYIVFDTSTYRPPSKAVPLELPSIGCDSVDFLNTSYYKRDDYAEEEDHEFIGVRITAIKDGERYAAANDIQNPSELADNPYTYLILVGGESPPRIVQNVQLTNESEVEPDPDKWATANFHDLSDQECIDILRAMEKLQPEERI